MFVVNGTPNWSGVFVRFIMPPFAEEKAYCFAHVGRSVGLSVGETVRL